MKSPKIIVIGELNIDIVVHGLPRFPKAGELVNGNQVTIGAGGKSRNIAAMAGTLTSKGSVAMIAKTSRDDYGLWKVPVDALQQSNVDTTYVVVDGKAPEMPGIALILVDVHGANEIVGSQGITKKFAPEDVAAAKKLFARSGVDGFLVFTGNCPLPTARRAIQLANEHGLKVLFDPGGADNVAGCKPILKGLYLVKPNEHEAYEITGIRVTNFASAKRAADAMKKLGAQNVLITAGADGAYLFAGAIEQHLSVMDVTKTDTRDETGCGDQTMATLAASLKEGKSLEAACAVAVLSGTLQFYKAGIVPVTKEEIDGYQA